MFILLKILIGYLIVANVLSLFFSIHLYNECAKDFSGGSIFSHLIEKFLE